MSAVGRTFHALEALHGRDVARATSADSAELAALLASGADEDDTACPECGDPTPSEDCCARARDALEGARLDRAYARHEAACDLCGGSGTQVTAEGDFRRCECAAAEARSDVIDGSSHRATPVAGASPAVGGVTSGRGSDAEAAAHAGGGAALSSSCRSSDLTFVECPACDGSGSRTADEGLVCAECRGEGVVLARRLDTWWLARLRGVAEDVARAVAQRGSACPGESPAADDVHGATELLLIDAWASEAAGARLPLAVHLALNGPGARLRAG